MGRMNVFRNLHLREGLNWNKASTLVLILVLILVDDANYLLRVSKFF